MHSLLNKDTIESIYEKAADILANVGVEFELESALELFNKNGAKTDGKRVFIAQSLLKKTLDSMPKVDYTPAHKKRLVAASPFSNASMIIDDITGTIQHYMISVEEIWCYPGHMAAFAGGSFKKMILDEELMINCNRTLQGLNLAFDPILKDKLEKSLETKSFLTIGSTDIYRKEQRVSTVLDKKGIKADSFSSKNSVDVNVSKEIEKRCAAYVLPDRTQEQKDLLQKYLPSQCKY